MAPHRGWLVALVVLVGCSSPPPPSIPAPVPTTNSVAAPVPTRPLAVAVAVGSPTPTPVLSGDYASLVRPRLATIRQGLSGIEQLLAAAKAEPIRMAQDDWRNQLETISQDLLTQSSDLRRLATRLTGQSPMNPQILKVADDVEFDANEFHMMLDYDPDASHFFRATRAEVTTAKEVDSALADLH